MMSPSRNEISSFLDIGLRLSVKFAEPESERYNDHYEMSTLLTPFRQYLNLKRLESQNFICLLEDT